MVSYYRKALENIFRLLRTEGGDCLMIFFSYNNVFDCNNYISQSPKWSQYIKDVHRFIAPLQYCDDAKMEFENMMAEAGFCNVHVDLKAASYNYGSLENFIGKLVKEVKSVSTTLRPIIVSCRTIP